MHSKIRNLFLITVPLSLSQVVYADAPVFLTASGSIQNIQSTTMLGSHAKRVGKIQLNIAPLRSSSRNGTRARIWLAPQLRLRPFPDVDVTLDGVRTEDTPDGSETWVGHTDFPLESDAVLTLHNNNLTGRIDIGTDQYLITTAPDGSYSVTEIDPATYTANLCLSGIDETSSPATTDHPQLAAIPASVPTSNTVDLLIAYTQSVAIRNGFDPASYINNLVADANNSLTASGANVAFRVVAYALYSDYNEPTTPNSNAYDWITLVSDMDAGSVVTPTTLGTGSFANLKSLRDSYQADQVVFLVSGSKWTGTCGYSDLIPPYPDAMRFNDISAYTMLSDSCAAGDRTFTHELGHHLGGRHNWQQANEPLGFYDSTSSSLFPGNHGYWYSGSSLSFKTMMAVWPSCAVSGCARINRWSSYNQTYSGVPLGIQPNPNPTPQNPSHPNDMVSTLNGFASEVAQYRTPAGLATPDTPTDFSSWYCSGATTVSWSATGTIGWYEAYNANYSPQRLIYRGGNSSFQASFGSNTIVKVRACNAASCGSYGSTSVPATQSGCIFQ